MDSPHQWTVSGFHDVAVLDESSEHKVVVRTAALEDPGEAR
jgi:hypothetical protein